MQPHSVHVPPRGTRKKQKIKLRELSRRTPTRAEVSATMAAFDAGVPIVIAILGQALIENELEQLLRPKFKRKDDASWSRLTDENGPLDTFNRKIRAAYAFGIIDDITQKNITVVRNIRNAFAHSKRLIDFNDEAILHELSNVTAPKGKTYRAKALRVISATAKEGMIGADLFRMLCRQLTLELMRRQLKNLQAGRRRNETSRKEMARRLLSSPFGGMGLLSDRQNFLAGPPKRAA
jgi:DNA-binding MltR family transcriptional regulator